MIELIEKITSASRIDGTLTLSFDERKRGRLKTALDSGEPAGIFLDRGSVLLNGQLLRARSGFVVRVVAAQEQLSEARLDDPVGFAMLCYHLGNRHTALEIGAMWVRYQTDYVLDDLCAELGAYVLTICCPFSPQQGAYTHHNEQK